MTTRRRVVALVAVTALLVAACVVYAVADLRRARQARATPPGVATTRTTDASGGYLVFRHTGLDREYGVVATVPLADAGGARGFTGTACDRVDATRSGGSCLVTDHGLVTTYEALDLDAGLQVTGRSPLAGVPSRTRMSPDGSLVASTAFVAGHSYLQVGFSTSTVVRRSGATSSVDLEDFTLRLDGQTAAPVDRNVWGVTFAPDDDTFYATVGTGGTTYLVRGDLSERTLTSVVRGVECPSLSPDGTRVAFKQAGVVDGRPGWTPAVLDLASGRRTVLDGETRDVDDQLEWLDDQTVLYGLPRTDEPGVTDIWSLRAEAGATPTLLVEEAWSPSVVR